MTKKMTNLRMEPEVHEKLRQLSQKYKKPLGDIIKGLTNQVDDYPDFHVDEKRASQSIDLCGTFNRMKEMAQYLAESDLVPEHFRRKPANVFIALEYAYRMNMSPFMVMQSLFVVHGRPGLEAKLITALVNSSGMFAEPLEFVFEGKPGSDDYGCYAQVRDKHGRHIKGPKVTWRMVTDEGWNKDKEMKRDGRTIGVVRSKWNTMPEIMFRYRAAAFFAKTVCPQVLMGMSTVEELEDAVDLPLAEEPQLMEPDVAAIEETFWEAFEEINDPNLNLFLDETAQALGRPRVEVMQGALEKQNDFVKAYRTWLSDREEPEEEQSQPDVPDYPEAPSPDVLEERITTETMNEILKACRERKKPLAVVLNDAGARGKLLKDLTETQGRNILAGLI